jgi:nucleoside-diphosphate-sugar epimerase
MEKVLIVGCGDVAMRALPMLLERYRVSALVRQLHAGERLAALGVGGIVGDLDDPASLAPLAGLADRIVHLAPPPDAGAIDTRTRNLVAALTRDDKAAATRGAMVAQAPRAPARLVYISTSGVYGDCRGAYVDELRPVNARTDRARRRVDAEQTVLAYGRTVGVNVSILRVPGIYATDRLPLERLKRGTPVLAAEDDVYTNHIHADDLAAIVVAALERAQPGTIYNASDDSEMKMSEWFDLLADRAGLPRPPRVRRAEASECIAPMLLSFMSESRRLVNAKMKRELGITLRYPTVREGVPARLSVASN